MKNQILWLLFATLFMPLVYSCSNDDEPPSITERHYKLKVGETLKIQGENLDGLSWESFNEYVANVSSDGIIHGLRVGFAPIMQSSVGGIHVIVEPKIKIYSEPIVSTTIDKCCGEENYCYDSVNNLIFGSYYSFAKIHQEEFGYNWILKKETTEGQVWSTGNPASPYVAYLFDSNKKIGAVGIYIEYAYGGYLFNFLNERFVMYSWDENKHSSDFAKSIKNQECEKAYYIGKSWDDTKAKWLLVMYYGIDSRNGNESYQDKFEKIGEMLRK